MSGTVRMSLAVENHYRTGGIIKKTFEDVEVVSPPPVSDEQAFAEWAFKHLYAPYTGTGRTTGDAAYFLTITACSDPALVGAEFEWGT